MNEELERMKQIANETNQRIADRNIYRARLINMVRLNPILWDKKSPNFNQRVAKLKKWMELAKQLGVSSDKIRRTWENLRDQYRRDLKRTISTGARSKWRFFNDMNFIRSMVRIKPSSAEYHSETDSDQEFEECSVDTFHLCPYEQDKEKYFSNSTTSTAASEATTSGTRDISNKTPTEFLPIQLNTEWKQREAFEKELYQEGQQEIAPQKQLQMSPQLKISKISELQQDHFDSQPQQNCDSSEEQKYAENDEVYEVDNSNFPAVIKIELDSDSDDESLIEVLKQQREQRKQQRQIKQLQPQQAPQQLQREHQEPQQPTLQSQQSPQQQQPRQQLQQQIEKPEPAREPRPSAPRPDISRQHECEEFVTTSDMAIKRPKRRRSTQSNATAENNFSNGYRSKRALVASATDAELQDEDYHFVMSILPSLREVTRQRKFPLRSQIMNLISKELEESNN